jgi:prophage regulatory protein
MNMRLVSIKTLEKRYEIGRSTLYRWIKDGRFPAPKKLGPRIARWDLTETDAAMGVGEGEAA